MSSYDDGCTRLDRDGILLRRYYFPLARHKRIAWADVRAARTERLSFLNGRWRLWGWGANLVPATWLGLDLRRHRRGTKVVLDVGGRLCPAFTPEDPPKAIAFLREQVIVEERLTKSDR
jgi:hypothetical protein